MTEKHMHLTRYSRILFAFIGVCLAFLMVACSSGSPTPPVVQSPTSTGTASTTGGTTPTVTTAPTTAPMPTTQTSCPASGTGRAAVMAPLALGGHQNIVYLANVGTSDAPTSSTLKRYDVSTGNSTDIKSFANTYISDPQVSADGQWILFVAIVSGQAKLQMIRLDAQGLQTLYCATPPSNGANPASAVANPHWSTDQKLVIFDSYNSSGSFIDLLNMQNGSVQAEISSKSSGAVYPILTWLDTTRVYLLNPTIDMPSSTVYVLDTTKGANQDPNHLQQVFNAPNQFCWDADSSYNATQLYTSSCTTDPNPQGPGISAQHGPSSISVGPATGGSQNTIFTNSKMAVTTIRAISKATLLLTVNNNGTSTDTSQNGLWKVNTDGTGLTQLTSSGGGVSAGPDTLCPFTQFPWSNVSRDGTTFAVQHNSANGQSQSLIFGSLNGGTTTIFAPNSNGTQLAIVGWTTM